MKKIIKLGVLIITLLSITGCGKSYMKEISYSEYKNLIENKETFILEIMRTDCSACINFKPKITDVANNYKVEVKSKGIMAGIGSFMGIKMEMFKDNSDARIADMLTKGLTMGQIDITKKIKNYEKVADKEVIDLAKKILEAYDIVYVFLTEILEIPKEDAQEEAIKVKSVLNDKTLNSLTKYVHKILGIYELNCDYDINKEKCRNCNRKVLKTKQGGK